MAKRKPSKQEKCARSELEQEHAFDQADGLMTGHIDDAREALALGSCYEAGVHIDKAYIAYGRMLENAPPATAEWAQAEDQRKQLLRVDQPFEKKCVRPTPDEGLHEKSRELYEELKRSTGLQGELGSVRLPGCQCGINGCHGC